jgi:hypothetical protein
MPISTAKDDAAIAKLQARAANLKIDKIKSVREFIDARGKKLTPEEQAAIQKRRHLILYQLELEGAEIEREIVVAYRRKFGRVGITYHGLGLETSSGCFPVCSSGCVVGCQICVTDCTVCVACNTSVF